MREIIECVPNFSEGRDKSKVDAIVQEIRSVPGTYLLDVEMNADHNRAVVSFVGDREAVKEAAFRAVKRAADLIDLNKHRGEHPRIGAADVVPFVPISGVTMDDCVAIAREVGQRIGEELGIPVYLYEKAATRPERENLANIRKGEFEGLKEELGVNPERDPDFGPRRIHPTAGATVVGARDFLIAYNVNLGTSNIDIAKRIAKAVRFSGGGLRYVKALGFEIRERDIVQVSMNLTNFRGTPIFRAFELIRTEAERYGVPVIGSEIVGLVPNDALVDVADFYLRLENFSRSQIIENRLMELAAEETGIESFVDQVASKAPTPGGGSVSALAGALAGALTTMVCQLTLGKKKYEDVEEDMRSVLEEAQILRRELSELMREDAKAFEAVMEAYKLPKDTDEQKQARSQRIQEATRRATEVPLAVMQKGCRVLELTEVAAQKGNINAISDAGVAALMAHSAVQGAYLNVLINLPGLEDAKLAQELRSQADQLAQKAQNLQGEILKMVRQKLGA